MTTTLFARCCVALAFVVPVNAQETPPQSKPSSDQSKKSESALRTWDDKEAKVAIEELNQALKGKPSVQSSLMALEKLKEGRNGLLVAPLQKLILKSNKLSVRKAAAELIGNQPKEQARKSILTLLKNKTVEREPSLQATLLLALGRESYDPRDWADLDKKFRKLRDNPEKENAILEKAIVQLAGKAKEKQALRTLIDSMDAPQPANVDDPANPPADYWKARWENWEVWRADAKDSIFAITGQRFSSRKEALEWLRANARKIGVK